MQKSFSYMSNGCKSQQQLQCSAALRSVEQTTILHHSTVDLAALFCQSELKSTHHTPQVSRLQLFKWKIKELHPSLVGLATGIAKTLIYNSSHTLSNITKIQKSWSTHSLWWRKSHLTVFPSCR